MSPNEPMRTKRPGCTVGVLCALLVSSCGDQAGGSTWQITVDTIDGVSRVLNTPPKGGPVPTRVGEETLRIGTVEGGRATSFGMIRQLAVLPDGRIAVADGQAQEVRLFGADGRHLRTFGGAGAGPGELRGLQGVHVGPDGMLRVPEQANARLTVFDPDSGFVMTYPLRLYSYGFRGPWAAAVDSSGRTLVASSGQYGEGRFWNMVRVYDQTMNQVDSIPYHEYTDVARRATAEGGDDAFPGTWRIALGSGSWTWAGVPFYSQAHQVLAPTGEFWSSEEGQLGLEVARWASSGDTSLILTSHRKPEPVTAAERDSAMAELRERLAERVSTPLKLDASRVPATKPPLYGLSLDDAGRLWVRLTESSASTVYDVFARDGRHAETVRLSFRVDPFVPPVVRGDTLWAIIRDDMDVQYVVRAALTTRVEVLPR